MKFSDCYSQHLVLKVCKQCGFEKWFNSRNQFVRIIKIILCLHRVICCQVFLPNTNNLTKVKWFQNIPI